jgi:PleD family two-component response regulator
MTSFLARESLKIGQSDLKLLPKRADKLLAWVHSALKGGQHALRCEERVKEPDDLSPRVLIADDSEPNRELLTQFLQHEK